MEILLRLAGVQCYSESYILAAGSFPEFVAIAEVCNMTTCRVGLPSDLKRRLERSLPRHDGAVLGVQVTPRDRAERKCAAYDADHYEIQAYYTRTGYGALDQLEKALAELSPRFNGPATQPCKNPRGSPKGELAPAWMFRPHVGAPNAPPRHEGRSTRSESDPAPGAAPR